MNKPFRRALCRSGLWLASTVLALGQTGNDPVAKAEDAVQKTTAAWQALSKDLDARIARLLPCDPKAKTAIDEVSRASQARLVAIASYYETALTQASTRSEGAKRLLASEQARSASLAEDRAHAEQAVAALAAQTADLAEGAATHPALGPAQAALRQAAEITRQRTALAGSLSQQREGVLASLQALSTAYAAYEDALKQEQTLFQSERTRWNGYYAARSARSQTECAITTSPSDAPAAAKPKPAGSGKSKQGKTK